MANYLDTLLSNIDDEALRSNLQDEIEKLRSQKQFGLVFERHLPERVRLYGHPIRSGITVQEKSESDGPIWTVMKMSKGIATICTVANDEVITENRSATDLVAVREFGAAIYTGLKSLGVISRGGEKPYHTVINAENYHAIETLSRL